MRLNHLVGILVVGALALGAQLGAAQYGGGSEKAKPAPAAKSGATHSMTGCLAISRRRGAILTKLGRAPTTPRIFTSQPRTAR